MRTKNSFTLLELIFVLLILAIISSQVNIQNNLSKIKLAKEQIIKHLKYTRYIAMIDHKYDDKDEMWFRKRWTLKFQNCNKSIGGIYYAVYSDENKKGNINKSEALRDPITKNLIYAKSCKEDSLYDKSKFVLLTNYYNIKKVNVSCNNTNTIGQISFGYDGNVYSKLGINEDEINNYLIKEPCFITIIDKDNEEEKIKIHPFTGFIEDI